MKSIDDDFNESELFSAEAIGNHPAIANQPVPAAASAPASPSNPLAAYFRVPGLSVAIPTGGRYFPEGACTMDALGQLEIFPMRGADEMLLKAPDALMSGLAVEKLIESCVPGIKSPHLVSTPDLDVLLLAIRAATFGNIMPVEVKCPECEAEMEFECDLQSVLATSKPLPQNLDLRLSDEVVVEIRPHTLASQTKVLLAAYDEQRKIMMAEQEDDDDARQAHLRHAMAKIDQFQNESIANSVAKVSIPNAEVTDRKHILDFVINAEREWSDAMRKRVEEVNNMGIDRNLNVQCGKCEHSWVTTLEFNPSSFFAPSSSN